MTDSPSSFVRCPDCDLTVRLGDAPRHPPLRCPRCQRPLSAMEVLDGVSGSPAVQATDRDADEEDYRLSPGTGQPPRWDVRYIAVTCAVCGTRLHATEHEIGQSIKCHDCGRSTVVRAPRRVAPRRPHVADDDPPIALGAVPVRADYELPTEGHRAGRWDADEDSGERDRQPDESLPHGPLALFQGVWSIAWQRECWRLWLVFSAWLLLLDVMALMAVAMFMVPAMGFASVGPWILAAGLIVAVLVFGTLWAVFFSVRLVTIVVDTAAGSRRIVNWPDALFLDSVPDALYVLLAATVAAVPASVFSWLIDPAPLGWAVASVVFLLLYPVVHLSMLERGSKLVPLSPLVLASLGKAWWAWLIVLVESGLLLAATAGLIATGYWAIGRWAIVPAAALVPAALMVYFRLLGRLAWCCTMALNEPRGQREKIAPVDHHDRIAAGS